MPSLSKYRENTWFLEETNPVLLNDGSYIKFSVSNGMSSTINPTATALHQETIPQLCNSNCYPIIIKISTSSVTNERNITTSGFVIRPTGLIIEIHSILQAQSASSKFKN